MYFENVTSSYKIVTGFRVQLGGCKNNILTTYPWIYNIAAEFELIVGGIFQELKETIQNQEKLHRAFRKWWYS